MDAFLAMLGIVLLFVALLIPGYVLGKTGALTGAAVHSFGNLLMYVAMPFLVFSKLLDIDFFHVDLLGILISALLPVVLEACLLLACKFIFRGEDTRKRAAVFCAVFPNCGFLGIPLAAAMWPQRPEIVLYISVFNVVSTFMLLTVGVFILSQSKKDISLKKALISPIFFAIVLGVAASLLNAKAYASGIETYAVTLAQLTTPLAMISLGYELSGLRLSQLVRHAEIYTVSLLKLILSPLIVIGCLTLLKHTLMPLVPASIPEAMLVAAAVSTAASAPSMAEKYGVDAEYTAALTLSNTLLCAVTLPLMYVLCSVML